MSTQTRIHTIPINLFEGAISMPIDVAISGTDAVTWEVPFDPEARWLISFQAGAPFLVENVAARTTTRSLEVRNGQQIRPDPQNPRKGKFLYRVALHTKGKIYGVFDCPSIIVE
ncbi:MAG TPA: hypothetical protein VFL83_19940 [Anaeromyxobacter sp.]|nr:hypothetical protein [Anaeromyxobacter sp.]